ncbi:MAG: TraU family protein, partial [Rhodobacteraceae bacterium]|nr:TraU family protein [Paracoccaceae bacterium]
MSRYAALLMLLLSAPIPAPAADTPGWSAPLSLNMPLSCFRFMPVGLCVWITCTPFGCDIDTSIKFGHFNPDAVVELVNPQGVNRVEAPRRPDMRNRNHNNLIYKDAHALGHPLAGQFYCPSQAIPLMPYFYSPADPLGWRWGLPD